MQSAAIGDVIMRNEHTVERLAVEGDLLNVDVFSRSVVGYDGEVATRRQVDDRLVEDRTTDGIFGSAWTYWVEAEGREDVPCRHLSCIVVASQSVV